ncbi:hypothetical protein HDU93_000755, partial [Gonapodya sp. JEL0774]
MPPVASESPAANEARPEIAVLKTQLTNTKPIARPRPSVTREESATLSDLAPREVEEQLFPTFPDVKYPAIPLLSVTD